MTQLFSRDADKRVRLALVVGALLVILATVTGYAASRSDATWRVGSAADQPIPFSHAVHAGSLGLECRFCHTQASHGAAAGMPSGETCLGCHKRVWPVDAQLVPLRAAIAAGAATQWASVHRLPDHVRFHHGAHVSAGIGCAACHGAVETMPRTVKTQTLGMAWCLDCHRAPQARGARPNNLGVQVLMHGGVQIDALTNCTVCHR